MCERVVAACLNQHYMQVADACMYEDEDESFPNDLEPASAAEAEVVKPSQEAIGAQPQVSSAPAVQDTQVEHPAGPKV